MKDVDIEQLNVPSQFKIALRKLVNLISVCENVKEIVVFGSVAREECTNKSDIDICIFSDLDESELLTNSVVNGAFFKLLDEGINIEFDVLVYYGVEDLKEKGKLEADILANGISIYKK